MVTVLDADDVIKSILQIDFEAEINKLKGSAVRNNFVQIETLDSFEFRKVSDSQVDELFKFDSKLKNKSRKYPD